MLRTIHLTGDLGNKYDTEYKLDVNSVGEAIHAINILNNNKFLSDIKKDGYYDVIVGNEHLDDTTIQMNHKKGDIWIHPIVSGAKNGGVVSFVTGMALIAVGAVAYIYAPGNPISPFLFKMGAGMILAGISYSIWGPKTPNYDDREDAKERRSYLFNGPTNTVEQGGCIPMIYGNFYVGSTVVSASLDVEDITVEDIELAELELSS